MSVPREITPHRAVQTLMTGHFIERSGYFAYRPKGTSDYLLVYTLAGLGRFGTSDGREHLVKPYDLVLIAPGIFQDYSVELSKLHWEFLWSHFQPRADWLDLLDWPEIEPGMMRISVPDAMQQEVSTCFRRVHQSAMSSGPLRDRVAFNALEALLLLCEQLNPNRSAHCVDQRLRKVMDHVIRNLEKRLTLENLSEIAGLSVSRLGHRFRELMGVSPMVYIERQRMERAKQLLVMTGLSIKEISHHVGYDSQFYFSLRFKKATDTSPTSYRNHASAHDH